LDWRGRVWKEGEDHGHPHNRAGEESSVAINSHLLMGRRYGPARKTTKGRGKTQNGQLGDSREKEHTTKGRPRFRSRQKKGGKRKKDEVSRILGGWRVRQ